MISQSKLEWATEESGKAFWVEVTRQFPEITTNELDVGTTLTLQIHMRNAIEKWIQINLAQMEGKK